MANWTYMKSCCDTDGNPSGQISKQTMRSSPLGNLTHTKKLITYAHYW